jgi:uncharacterized protein (DUF885 family)
MYNVATMGKILLLLCAVALMAGCGPKPSETFAKLSGEFVNTTLSFSPIAATQAGLHHHDGQTLDDLLDDLSPAALEKQRQFYRGFRDRLAALKASDLDPQDRADLRLLQDQVALSLLDLEELHSAQHNPTIYVEALGSAFFAPYTLEYAAPATRYKNIIERMKQVPWYLEHATANLTAAPDIWTKVAIEENQGTVGLLSDTIRKSVPAELRDQYDGALKPAVDALTKFHDFLVNQLANQTNADWRLGRDRYAKKFRYVLESSLEPDAALAQAEQALKSTRARMLQIALPLYAKMGRTEPAGLTGEARENHVIGAVLNEIAKKQSKPEAFLDDARKDLDQARAFVAAKRLLTLPASANLQVIPTPEFMRGVYSVAGFSPAPALEPKLGAFYWVTPIPANWPWKRIDSKLREYNSYGMQLLTIHEAMPGHYVQFEFAGAVEPKTRRVLRAVYGNNPYIEGWAVYATETMLEQGYLDHSPEAELTFLKQMLRVYANTIIDIRLQTMSMTDEQALDLMETRTFQEKEEAEGKLQRAKLTSCQLPVYFVGWRGWKDLRAARQKAQGAAFNLTEFHDRALKQGAVPLAELGALLQ